MGGEEQSRDPREEKYLIAQEKPMNWYETRSVLYVVTKQYYVLEYNAS